MIRVRPRAAGWSGAREVHGRLPGRAKATWMPRAASMAAATAGGMLALLLVHPLGYVGVGMFVVVLGEASPYVTNAFIPFCTLHMLSRML